MKFRSCYYYLYYRSIFLWNYKRWVYLYFSNLGVDNYTYMLVVRQVNLNLYMSPFADTQQLLVRV